MRTDAGMAGEGRGWRLIAAILAALAACLGNVNGLLARQNAPAPPPSTPAAPGQPVQGLAQFEGRLIREVRLEGFIKVHRQLVENQVRMRAGAPLSLETVEQDIKRLTHLGRFAQIDATAQPLEDQTVVLTFKFVEAPLIEDVQASGNRQLTDTEIAGAISLLKGTAVDRYQLDRSRRAIIELYRKKGYYQAEVSIDETELEKTGIVLFRISEGERMKVRAIRFEAFDGGKLSFRPGQLDQEIKTKVAGLFETGPLDDETLTNDEVSLTSFYQDRGYLDVRVGRRVQEAPNRREAIVTFILEEGAVYTLRSVRAELESGAGLPPAAGRAPTVLTAEQIAGLMEIKAGDVYSVDKIRKSVRAVQDAYGSMGYVDARVGRTELRDVTQPQVDLLLLIVEGSRYKTGLVPIRGNELTQQRMILQQIRLRPDRPLDLTAVEQTKRALEETRLFAPGKIKVTIQPEDEARPGYRDVLTEVEETNTGSLGFGVGVSSDSGLIGQIALEQRNFDIQDTPDSFGELFNGRAFRGAGQRFNLTIAPGTDTQTYSISLGEPNLFDTDYSGRISGSYVTRDFDEYDEDRLGAQVAIGRRFGERWTGDLSIRAAQINIRNIDSDAPVDVFEVEGESVLTGVGGRFTRLTTDSRTRPSAGTKLEFGIEQVGALGGDYTFNRLTAEHVLYMPINEDFLGRRTVLSATTLIGYIPQNPDEVPTFERLYLGGRNFRGFDFRTVSPKGIQEDTMMLGTDPVGGTWSFFAGVEVEQPLWEQLISGVAFVDTGTVIDTVGFDDYRVSVGLGLRLYLGQLSPVPFAFDFGFPVLKQDGDEERLFTFSIDIPFR